MKKKWKDALVGRLGYKSNEADTVIQDLERLSPVLQPILDRWLADGTESNSQVFHWHSIDSLRARSPMNFIAALLTLDWIVRDPDKATSVIRKGIK